MRWYHQVVTSSFWAGWCPAQGRCLQGQIESCGLTRTSLPSHPMTSSSSSSMILRSASRRLLGQGVAVQYTINDEEWCGAKIRWNSFQLVQYWFSSRRTYDTRYSNQETTKRAHDGIVQDTEITLGAKCLTFFRFPCCTQSWVLRPRAVTREDSRQLRPRSSDKNIKNDENITWSTVRTDVAIGV